jgi:hypothetical protein
MNFWVSFLSTLAGPLSVSWMLRGLVRGLTPAWLRVGTSDAVAGRRRRLKWSYYQRLEDVRRGRVRTPEKQPAHIMNMQI